MLKYLAQNILTGAWLDMDVPITRDEEQPRFELSGAGSFSGTIAGDHPWLHANSAADTLREWSTALYVELDGAIVWGGIVQDSEYDGPDWRITAYGFVAYPNGLPYTGSYQKIIDKDPGVVWAKLWQHVQSQPDGALGLKLVMPDQLGPNVGTKDEPYELSWWEAKDVGDELQTLASDAPFDYVESHAWAVPAVTPMASGARPTVSVGCGNLQGAKPGNSHGNWQKNRADDQCDLISSMGLDIFAASELHEEPLSGMPDGTHVWFAGRMRETQHPAWALAVGDGGNHALYRSDVVQLVSTKVRSGIDDPAQGGDANMRSATLWTFRHLATGFLYPVSGRHLHSDDNDGTSRRGSRLAEAHDVDQLDGNPAQTIAVGDWNSYSMGAGEVYGIIEAETGLQPMNKRTTPLNAQMNSYGKQQKGRWIDNQLSNPNVWDISNAAGVPTRGLTDHKLWLRADYTPRAAPAVAASTGGDLSRKVLHTVTLSYPRAGARRQDLRFVQGENVLETVTLKRTGEDFANGVVTLGKGEGSKTLRGDDTVRDGRLRRVALYTDKLAGSKDRCKSLARRERGYRGLGLQVESIVVDGTHPHAPIGSWALGDDILVEAYGLPNLGDVADWYRIMGWSFVTDTTARLYLERADAFTYGPVIAPPDDDVPELDQEVGDR